MSNVTNSLKPGMRKAKIRAGLIESGEAISYTSMTLAAAVTLGAANFPGRLVHLSNGNGGAACLARSDGTNWKVNGGTVTCS